MKEADPSAARGRSGDGWWTSADEFSERFCCRDAVANLNPKWRAGLNGYGQGAACVKNDVADQLARQQDRSERVGEMHGREMTDERTRAHDAGCVRWQLERFHLLRRLGPTGGVPTPARAEPDPARTSRPPPMGIQWQACGRSGAG